MNTAQLEEIMRRAEGKEQRKRVRVGEKRSGVFCGVFARNEIPIIDDTSAFPLSFIANTDSDSEPGQHWVAFFFLSVRAYEFFDSFASTSPLFYHFSRISPAAACTRKLFHPIQSLLADTCGHHCLYFLIHRYRFPFATIVNRFSKVDLAGNDRLVTRFIFINFHNLISDHLSAYEARGGGKRTLNMSKSQVSLQQQCIPRSMFVVILSMECE